jgi:hypothetical protein
MIRLKLFDPKQNATNVVELTSKPKRSIERTTRFLCCTSLLFAAQFPAAAQNSFTDTGADGIKAFLRDNFRQTNAYTAIGLADQRGNRIFSARKLDNGTDRDVNGDIVVFIGSV